MLKIMYNLYIQSIKIFYSDMNLFVNLIKRTAKQFLNNNNYYSIKDYEKKYRLFFNEFFFN